MGQKSDRMLRELVEKEDIRDLVHRYCWAVDRADLEDVMALFHGSCDLIVSPPGRRREGRDAVERWYGRYMRHRPVVLRHLIHNQVITLDGEQAFSKSYFDPKIVPDSNFVQEKIIEISKKARFFGITTTVGGSVSQNTIDIFKKSKQIPKLVKKIETRKIILPTKSFLKKDAILTVLKFEKIYILYKNEVNQLKLKSENDRLAVLNTRK